MSININPMLSIDSYKTSHVKQYPLGTTSLYSNFTARSDKYFQALEEYYDHKVVFFGIQGFIKDVLIEQFQNGFFKRPHDEVVGECYDILSKVTGNRDIDISNISDLHKLGYLPLKIKALPEGSSVNIKIPLLTITNTLPEYFWLVNYIETMLSTYMWKPITSATIAKQYYKLVRDYADKTCDNYDHMQYQCHDFGCRGMGSMEDAMKSSAGHLLYFTGSDTIQSNVWLQQYYKVNDPDYVYSTAVPGTEHSVMCVGKKENECETYKRLIHEFPKGIFSIVSDTWDIWKVLTNYLPKLKKDIEDRDGTIVIRPDCLTSDTEILTPQGWKCFTDLTEDSLVAQVSEDNKTFEFVKPSRIINHPYKGTMYHFKNSSGSCDITVTPNHRMVLKNTDGTETIMEAEELYAKTNEPNDYNGISSVLYYSPSSDTDNDLSEKDKLLVQYFNEYGKVYSDMEDDKEHLYNVFDNTCRGPYSPAITMSLDSNSDMRVAMRVCRSMGYDESSSEDYGLFTDDMSEHIDFLNNKTLSTTWVQKFVSLVGSTCKMLPVSVFNNKCMDLLKRVLPLAGYTFDQADTNETIILTIRKVEQQVNWNNVFSYKTEYNGTVHCVTVPTGKILVKRNNCVLVTGNSGDQVKILCGNKGKKDVSFAEHSGCLELLWNEFGGTYNRKGYRVLNPKIGLVYGDGITLQKASAILNEMQHMGFASSNITLGVGSYTYQYNTRDTFGFAIKATHAVVNNESIDIFKDPITDDGVKKSAKGLLRVEKEHGEYVLYEQQTPEQEEQGELKTVFLDGELVREVTIEDLRQYVKK